MPRVVWLCEVITHVRGVLYGGGYTGTAAKIKDKVERARDFAAATFLDEQHRYEIWGPVVPRGQLALFEELEHEFNSADLNYIDKPYLAIGMTPEEIRTSNPQLPEEEVERHARRSRSGKSRRGGLTAGR